MNRTQKYIASGAVAIAAVALAVAAVTTASPDWRSDRGTASPATVRAAQPSSTPLAGAAASIAAPAAAETEKLAIAPLPPNAAAVPDDHLLRLAGWVNLANAVNEPPDKARWQQTLPVAEKLMEGPCDCEQRNWLKHYVAMGNYALSDSKASYKEEAEIITTLARNDNQAMAMSKARK